jgi:hypothetical protein
VLVALGAVTWVLGLLTKTPCAADGWSTTQLDQARLCADEWGFSGLATPSRSLSEPLPPLPWLLGKLVETLAAQASLAGDRVVLGAATTVVLVAAALLAAVVAAARTDPTRAWDGAVVALLVMVPLTWSTSWHTVAAAAIALGLWAWSRGRPRWAGVAFGAAGATVLSTLAVLVALLIVAALRGRGSRANTRRGAGGLADTFAASVLTWLALSGVRLLGDPDAGFAWWVRAVDAGSVWMLVSQSFDTTLSAARVTLAAAVLWVLWAAWVAWWLRGSRGPRWGEGPHQVRTVASVALLLVGGAVLLVGWAPPGLGLVLVPLAAFAVPRWGPLLVWQACEVIHFVLTGWYYGGVIAPGDGGHSEIYWTAIVLRLSGVVWLLAWAAWGLRVSAEDDLVEGGRRVADPDLDLLTDGGHPRPGGQEEHRGLHVRGFGEQALLPVDAERGPDQSEGVEPPTGDGGGTRLQ